MSPSVLGLFFTCVNALPARSMDFFPLGLTDES